MKVTNQSTDEAICTELGSKRTLERMESGASAMQLSAFIRVCRTLGLLDRFELLLPESVPSPIAQLKLGGRKRRRASGTNLPLTGQVSSPPQSPWTWGER
jgi:hypothetical protein